MLSRLCTSDPCRSLLPIATYSDLFSPLPHVLPPTAHLFLSQLWMLPTSQILFTVCFGLALGSLGTAIATWRNSLVFHSLDKVISLAIHFLPPFVMVVCRHFLHNGMRWEVARKNVGWEGGEMKAMGVCMGACAFFLISSFILSLLFVRLTASFSPMHADLIWQLAYYRFLLVAQRSKIESGQRVTSFTWLLKDKKSLVGKIGMRVREEWREAAFMVSHPICWYLALRALR